MGLMLRTLIVLDDHTTLPLGVEVVPAEEVITVTRPTILRRHTLGRFYDLIFVHEDCRMSRDEIDLYMRSLTPWGAVLTLRRP